MIHFEGWESKYDEDIPSNSDRIAPFRNFSLGYTGNPNKAVRPELIINANTLELMQ